MSGAKRSPAFAAALVRCFGPASDLASGAVQGFYAALAARGSAQTAQATERWRRLVAPGDGYQLARSSRAVPFLAAWYGLPQTRLRPAELLLAVQTYYALVVRLLIRQVVPGGDIRLGLGPEHDPWSWCLAVRSDRVNELVTRVWAAMRSFQPPVPGGELPAEDLFAQLYQAVFPRRYRHALGEYYTPPWLVRQLLDEVGYCGQPEVRLLDPACGSGAFLIQAIGRLRAAGSPKKRPSARNALLRRIASSIVGLERDPLAVLTARANYLLAVRDLLDRDVRVEVPVYCCDSILANGPTGVPECGQFDCVVGNPPWIAWDHLPLEYREATGPMWRRYGLFSLSGKEARHGGGKKDLSMLMVWVAADRWLKPSGRLAMVVPQTLLQTKGAGDGFRRFRLGEAGPPLRVLRVNDFVALPPFAEAANWTATILLEKGKPTRYPVPYLRWLPGRNAPQRYRARPVDPQRPGSPWLVWPQGCKDPKALVGPSDYQAHLGANSGGANGVYWVRLLDRPPLCQDHLDRQCVWIRNIAGRGKRPLPSVEHLVEAELLYPLLRWADLRRYRSVPRDYWLLVQDPQTRKGIDEQRMRCEYPHAYAYLRRFRKLLGARAAYRRYQSKGAFYSMYDVGPYTLAPIKVVWRRMDRRINAAVVGPVRDPVLGLRPVVPQETCVMVAAQRLEEAHYLCAVLNSSVVGLLVASHSVRGGKGFATPGMLEFVRLKRFDPDNSTHRRLAALSHKAHARAPDGAELHTIQEEIDRLAARLWGWI